MKFTVPAQGNRLIGAIAGVGTGRVLQTLVNLLVITHYLERIAAALERDLNRPQVEVSAAPAAESGQGPA